MGAKNSNANSQAGKNRLSDSDYITIRAVVDNVVYESKRTSLYFKLVSAGDTAEITVADLKEIRANHRKFLTRPWIIADDEQARLEFSELAAGYDAFYQVNDISWLYSGSDDAAISKINSIPKPLLDIFLTNVAQLIKDGRVTSYRVIRALEEKLGGAFEDLISAS